LGEPSSSFFTDDEVFADALTSYFTDHEPGSCFVAVVNGEVVGYVIGAKDTCAMNRVFTRSVALPLAVKALARGVFFGAKNLRFLSRCLASLVKGEFAAPDFSAQYPATLHINVDKAHRSSGVGSMLIGAYVEHLSLSGVKGVHLATMSEKAAEFFGKLGFQRLHSGKRGYFRHVLGTDVPVYVYGMRLSI
jgi:GNAT superfamily N-acetyltransferase